MSTNMPMFGTVILEIACDIFIHKIFFFPFKYVVNIIEYEHIVLDSLYIE